MERVKQNMLKLPTYQKQSWKFFNVTNKDDPLQHNNFKRFQNVSLL